MTETQQEKAERFEREERNEKLVMEKVSETYTALNEVKYAGNSCPLPIIQGLITTMEEKFGWLR
jgi:hypothetical protein